MKHLPLDVRVPIEEDNPSICRDENKCIKCGQCRDVCKNYISVLDRYTFDMTENKAICINCGQCSIVCPTKAITEKKEYHLVEEQIKDDEKVVIVSTSPSCRVSLGDEFNLKPGTFVEKKMVSLLRKLGFKYVLDTNFGADLTIVEEASELIERIKNKGVLPQFTSCCPAWVKFVETFYPEFIPNISSCKSPLGMQGPTIKTYFAKKMNIDPRRIINVALTPCTAKKFEIRREEMNASSKYHDIKDMRDMDYVITTRELASWAKEKNIDFASLEDSEYDSLMSSSSGAGTIFGNTGGVLQAALRTAYEFLTGKQIDKNLLEFKPVRGYESLKEASLDIDGLKLNVAVIYGTKEASVILDKIKNGENKYHFIEVMTCPMGCIGGGGQPVKDDFDNDEVRKRRVDSLYEEDRRKTVRKSHENPEIIKLYEEFYSKPLSDLSKKMLHTLYHERDDIKK